MAVAFRSAGQATEETLREIRDEAKETNKPRRIVKKIGLGETLDYASEIAGSWSLENDGLIKDQERISFSESENGSIFSIQGSNAAGSGITGSSGFYVAGADVTEQELVNFINSKLIEGEVLDIIFVEHSDPNETATLVNLLFKGMLVFPSSEDGEALGVDYVVDEWATSSDGGAGNIVPATPKTIAIPQYTDVDGRVRGAIAIEFEKLAEGVGSFEIAFNAGAADEQVQEITEDMISDGIGSENPNLTEDDLEFIEIRMPAGSGKLEVEASYVTVGGSPNPDRPLLNAAMDGTTFGLPVS